MLIHDIEIVIITGQIKVFQYIENMELVEHLEPGPEQQFRLLNTLKGANGRLKVIYMFYVNTL